VYVYRCEKYKRRDKDGGGDDTVARNDHVDGDVSLCESCFSLCAYGVRCCGGMVQDRMPKTPAIPTADQGTDLT
jgi:hypothetical protein